MRALIATLGRVAVGVKTSSYLPGLAVFFLVTALMAGGVLRALDDGLQDWRFRLLTRAATQDIVVVAIDSESLDRLQVWPWPRRFYADALDALAAAGASTIMVDIDFSATAVASDDAALEAALQRHGDRTFLPIFKQHQKNSNGPASVSVTRPLERFSRHVQLAAINISPATDGLIRTYPRFTIIDEVPYPSAAFVLSGAVPRTASDFVVDFALDPASVPRISFHDVLSGRFPAAMVEGRTVIIGATAVELGDRVAVPVWRNIAGPVLNALAADTLASEAPLRRLGPWPTMLGVLLLSLALTPRFGNWSWVRGGAVVIGVSSGAFGGTVAVQGLWSIIVPLAPVLTTVTAGYGVGLVTRINRQAISLIIENLTAEHRRALLDRVVRQSNDGIVILSSDGAVEQANPAARSILRQNATTTFPRLADVVEASTDAGGQMLRCLTSGDPAAAELGSQEVTLRERDGAANDDDVHVEIMVSEVRMDSTPSGSKIEQDYKLICVIRDVSERRRMEALRRKIIEDSLRVAEAKSQFFANMNHELRTPLNHIIGFAELLQGKFLGELNEKQSEYVGDIVGSGQELLQLITEILEYANNEDGEAKLFETDVDLHVLIEEIADIATYRAGGRLMAIINLAANHELPLVRADQRMLRQTLLNIVSNSLKFNDEPGHIVLDAKLETDGVSVVVTDDGAGMTADQINASLEPFARGEEAFNRSHDGHGLGLPLSKSLVEAHGGTLDISSIPGQGTQVTIRLPSRRVVGSQHPGSTLEAGG